GAGAGRQVQEGADRPQRVGERHDRAAVERAAARATLGRPGEAAAHLLGRGRGHLGADGDGERHGGGEGPRLGGGHGYSDRLLGVASGASITFTRQSARGAVPSFTQLPRKPRSPSAGRGSTLPDWSSSS